MDGPAAAPVLEMRLGVESCTLGPFPVPRLGGGGGPSPLKAAPERAAEGGRRSGRLEDQPRCPVGAPWGPTVVTVGRTVVTMGLWDEQWDEPW